MGRYDASGFEGSMIKAVISDSIINYGPTKGIVAGTTLKGINYAIHSSKSQSFIKEAIAQRDKLVNELGFYDLITLKQIHSGRIYVINNENKRKFLDCNVKGDGLLTDMKNTLIGVLTADCIPLFYFDMDGSFVGIAHAGWRGIKKRIHQRMLDIIFRNYGIKARDVIVVIGPHICNCCYEVQKDMYGKVDKDFIQERDSRLYLGLEDIVIRDLMNSGIQGVNINRYSFCTYCSENPSFYSYRKGDIEERMLSFIGRKD